MNSASSMAVFRWKPSCWLSIGGSDAATFLQGQFTNDLRDAGRAVYGLWLNTKGKVLADSFVIPAASGAYWICSYNSAAAVVQARLESHVIADDVEITDHTAEVAAITLLGDTGGTVARQLVASIGGACFRGHRFEEEHYECVFPQTDAARIDEGIAGFSVLTSADIERRRIASGTPAIPQDIGPNDLPNEGGLDQTAISYTKGCYLGQEVMARLKNLGQVRRRLVRVTGPCPAPPSLPAPLYVGDRVVGELRSAVINDGQLLGLALLTLLHLSPNAGLGFSATAKPCLTVLDSL